MCIFNLKKALSIYEIPAAETLRFLTLTIEFFKKSPGSAGNYKENIW